MWFEVFAAVGELTIRGFGEEQWGCVAEKLLWCNVSKILC